MQRNLMYTGYIQGVIELWSGLPHSKNNNSLTIGNNRRLAFECHRFGKV